MRFFIHIHSVCLPCFADAAAVIVLVCGFFSLTSAKSYANPCAIVVVSAIFVVHSPYRPHLFGVCAHRQNQWLNMRAHSMVRVSLRRRQ